MDAQVGGRPIIPRWGYMVEINALWYNAVCFALELALDRFGETFEELDVDYQGPEMAIGFNARYLLDILQVQDENRIRVLFKDQLSPGLLQPENDGGFVAVVMPMRL